MELLWLEVVGRGLEQKRVLPASPLPIRFYTDGPATRIRGILGRVVAWAGGLVAERMGGRLTFY